MNSLATQTRAHRLDATRCAVEISRDWQVWGPNGGYLSALVLQAVGVHADGQRPISFAGQYLRVPEFGRAIVEVRCTKPGRRVSAWSASLIQDDAVMLQAMIWTGESGAGLEYQLLQPPVHFLPLDRAGGRPPVGPMRFWDNLDIRAVRHDGGHYGHWYRFHAGSGSDDCYTDAARSLILIDTMQWPARYFMDDTPPPYVAPSLDLYVQFHRFNPDSCWLYSDALSASACAGLVAGSATVWDEHGHLLASGGSQSALRPLAQDVVAKVANG